MMRVDPICPASFGELPRAKLFESVDGEIPIRMAAAALFEESCEIIDVLAVAVSEGPQALNEPLQLRQPGTATREAQDPSRREGVGIAKACP